MIALADAIIAAQNTVVAAESLGIGSCYIGDILEQRESVTELLNLESFLVPAAMVVYGYPTEHQMRRPKPRRGDGAGAGESSFETFVRAFHDRKYASDSARELNRSASAYLRESR